MKSFLAILAGFVTVFALSTVTDLILHATHVFPPMGRTMSDPLFVLAFAYRALYTVLGCYLTARMAPDRPMRHALILGSVGFLVSLVGLAFTWSKGPEFGPKWYPVAIALSALPLAWLGGALHRTSAR
jgi:hypothetical protein